jgi:hypothetical protein
MSVLGPGEHQFTPGDLVVDQIQRTSSRGEDTEDTAPLRGNRDAFRPRRRRCAVGFVGDATASIDI